MGAERTEAVGGCDEDDDEIDDGEEMLPSNREVKLCICARDAPLLGDVVVIESDCASRIRFCNRALGELFITVVVTAVVSGWTIRVMTDAG